MGNDSGSGTGRERERDVSEAHDRDMNIDVRDGVFQRVGPQSSTTYIERQHTCMCGNADHWSLNARLDGRRATLGDDIRDVAYALPATRVGDAVGSPVCRVRVCEDRMLGASLCVIESRDG